MVTIVPVPPPGWRKVDPNVTWGGDRLAKERNEFVERLLNNIGQNGIGA